MYKIDRGRATIGVGERVQTWLQEAKADGDF
jgi:hypothetical protein